MIQEKLLEKSKEAFVMAIEIYNKPTSGAKEVLVYTYSHSETQPYPSRVSLFIV